MACKDNKPDIAKRMFWMFYADNYYTYPNGVVTSYTNLLSLIFMPFINDDLSIDFDEMAKQQPVIAEYIFVKLTNLVTTLFIIVRNASFKPYKYERDFEFIEERVHSILSRENTNDILNYDTAFWINCFSMIKNFSPQAYQEILSLLEACETIIKEELHKKIEPGLDLNPEYIDINTARILVGKIDSGLSLL
ncbi:MAG: hypothetical protein AB1782_14820 [Cyanobacteriota bacterium]